MKVEHGVDGRGRPVAVKRAESADDSARLRREADLLDVAGHPALVELLEFDDGPPAVMHTAWVAGRRLDERPLEVEEVAGVVAALASTLADLHAMGIVHGAVEPDHVLLDEGGRPVLCSLGRGGLTGERLAPRPTAVVKGTAAPGTAYPGTGGPGNAGSGNAGSGTGGSGTGGPGTGGTGTGTGGAALGNAGSGSAGPGTAGPGTAYPGTAYPGTAYPGTAYPGTAYPGTAYPGTAYPGTAYPGTAYPGTAGPGTAGPGTAGPGTAGPGTAGPGTAGPGTAGPGAGGAALGNAGSARGGGVDHWSGTPEEPVDVLAPAADVVGLGRVLVALLAAGGRAHGGNADALHRIADRAMAAPVEDRPSARDVADAVHDAVPGARLPRDSPSGPPGPPPSSRRERRQRQRPLEMWRRDQVQSRRKAPSRRHLPVIAAVVVAAGVGAGALVATGGASPNSASGPGTAAAAGPSSRDGQGPAAPGPDGSGARPSDGGGAGPGGAGPSGGTPGGHGNGAARNGAAGDAPGAGAAGAGAPGDGGAVAAGPVGGSGGTGSHAGPGPAAGEARSPGEAGAVPGGQQVRVPAGCPPVQGSLAADVDGDGCPEALRVGDGFVESGERRWVVGAPGDLLALGDWDCSGARSLAVLRPSTGEVFVFDGWAAEGDDRVAPLLGRVDGASTIRAADLDADGCNEIVVERVGAVPVVLRAPGSGR